MCKYLALQRAPQTGCTSVFPLASHPAAVFVCITPGSLLPDGLVGFSVIPAIFHTWRNVSQRALGRGELSLYAEHVAGFG